MCRLRAVCLQSAIPDPSAARDQRERCQVEAGLETYAVCIAGRGELEAVMNGLRGGDQCGQRRQAVPQVEADRLAPTIQHLLNAGAEEHGVGVVLVLGAMALTTTCVPRGNRAFTPAPPSLVSRLSPPSISLPKRRRPDR